VKVVVIGASGNVGTALLRALEDDERVDEVVGVARRPPGQWEGRTYWQGADVSADPLDGIMRGAGAVVHLAWLIQPARRRPVMHRVNVEGSRRVFEAAVAAGVERLVHASSVGAYSPGPKEPPVDETWPTAGIPSSAYSRDKAAVERLLDSFESERKVPAVVRLRPGIILQPAAGAEIARLFLGPLAPLGLLRPALIPAVPAPRSLRFQVVHSDDVARAYQQALFSDATGAFNVAAAPAVDGAMLGRLLAARPVQVPASVLRLAADVTWRLRLQPTEPGWVDMATQTPLMDTTRAEQRLGWAARHSPEDTLTAFLAALRAGRAGPTPVLAAGHRLGASRAPEPGAPAGA
jgi:UDP-glucose 4-epimerase